MDSAGSISTGILAAKTVFLAVILVSIVSYAYLPATIETVC